MKLTKQVEAEINLVYATYWKGLLSANLTTYANVLDENFKLIGTTESELFFKSSEAIQFLDATADQVAGNIELRNRNIKTEFIDSLVLITELSDTYVKINGTWTFYGKVRCSSILEKKMQEWKFIQMHLSFPDSKADDGQTIGLKQVEKENLELRDAVKRRTIELENKTRELEIEAALEKVRSRSLAMQKSEEFKDVIKIVYNQLTILKINLDHAGFVVDYTPKGDWHFWIADEQDIPSKITHPYFESVWANQFNDAKEKGSDFFATKLNFEEKNKFYKELLSHIPGISEVSKGFYLSCPGLAASTVLLENVGLYIENFSAISYTEEENNTLMRFGKVFQQTYTRFLDLQKAEAQTREAQINLAVERVRARALAMYKSEEILELVFKLKQEMMNLDIPNVVAATIHLKEKDGNYTMWDLTELDFIEGEFHQPMIVNYLLEEVDPNLFIKRMWEITTPYSLVVQDESDLTRTLQFLRDHNRKKEADESEDFIKTAGIKYVYHPTIPLNNGRMCIDMLESPSDEIEMILTKMGAAFDLAYKRFEDLKNSEAQLKEAQIEAALERVRSRTMGMQKSEELPNVANVLFQQVQLLGLPAWSAGYCNWDEDKQGITLWMSSEGVMQQPFHASLTEDPSFIHMKETYEKKQDFHVEEVGGEALVAHYQYMRTLPVVGEILDSIIAAGHPLPVFQIFHCAYFSQGFLLFITYEPVQEAHDIFKRFAKVFDQTYTRFLDLQKAEAQAQQAEQDLIAIKEAKQKAEEALLELQVTQKQLIQSEKMASLGELTAGIAHEIQNPLNFVNNFSEVSNELIQEIQEEREKNIENRDEALVDEILDDIKQNLEKINHHGKRADAIVKGMLQHSRSSSAVKEPTDINKLADEYLRLAYHGLRAKDKSFNATMKTEFDTTIGNINIIPQDIGRVILNLITNAFYATNEKSHQIIEGYEPTLTVSTKKVEDKVEIKVADNGNGIPKEVLDKIFQPFFTTKPTGQGTGLGLSLSYDIVKAHGGEIKVNTKENEGTTFTIVLPA